jgi:hypothetical protein
MMTIGFLLIPVGPIARMNNEGFGDAPGPIQVSDYWEGVSCVLIPSGGAIALLAAVLLMLYDRNQSRSGRSSTSCDNPTVLQDSSVPD